MNMFKKDSKIKDWLDDVYYAFRLHKVKDWSREVKWAWQRVFRGYDDTAYWNLDCYLRDIALPVLKWYKEHKHGFPIVDGMYDKPSEEQSKAWDEILNKMIIAFEIAQNDDMMEGKWWDLCHPNGEFNRKEWLRQNKLHQEGMILFGKYFRALWD